MRLFIQFNARLYLFSKPALLSTKDLYNGSSTYDKKKMPILSEHNKS